MKRSAGIFEMEDEGEILIVTPVTNMSELDYQQIEAGMGEVLKRLAETPARSVVLDFRKTDYYGTTALGCFIKLWKRVRMHGGGMAFCNVSEHEREILKVTKLDGLWPICSSKHDAIRAVTN